MKSFHKSVVKIYSRCVQISLLQKKQAATTVKPGSVGLDAYYAGLDAASSSQKKSSQGPNEDEDLKSESDEEVPYLVEAVSAVEFRALEDCSLLSLEVRVS